MLEINCSGSPREIGQWHGQLAADAVKRSIEFYKRLFMENTKLSWPEVCSVAKKFEPMLETNWSPYLEEMDGLATGAGVDFESILALNVRTEIAYGMAVDGCTALSWTNSTESYLAQNWDWQRDQKENLISLRIIQAGKPSIHMMTEAGIIGKIGLNSSGVGVTLNAIKAVGVGFKRLPCHLALRTVLESSSRGAAIQTLENSGVASSCHILVADITGGVGLECSALDIVQLPMADGIVTHTNHFIEPHACGKSEHFLPDTAFRLNRIRELLAKAGPSPSGEKIHDMLMDEKNYPGSICRRQTGSSNSETLFSIVMDLKSQKAAVKIGRPVTEEGRLVLWPSWKQDTA